MKKFTICYLSVLFTLTLKSISAKELTGYEAEKTIHGAERVIVGTISDVPQFIQFRGNTTIGFSKFSSWAHQSFSLSSHFDFKLLNQEKDAIGMTHYRYQETFDGIPLEGTMFIVHVRNGNMISMNGTLFNKLTAVMSPSLNESSALSKALEYLHADAYRWQNPAEEEQLRQVTGNPAATWFPKGDLMFAPLDGNFNSESYRLAYRFDVYAEQPLTREYVFVDASSGAIIYTLNRIHHSNSQGTAVTQYSGIREFTTDSVNTTTFHLRETGRGNGIETYNLQGGTNYVNTDFADADNYWNNVNANLDQYAPDAHWGAEETYDFYLNKFSRNSVDNAGFKLLNYVHYSNNYVNAFWDGSEMTFGDGDATYHPLTALDVIGHEISHGVTENTSNLGINEAGALNESFSDCMGNSIRYNATHPGSMDWLIGDQMGGTPFRSMSNPNAYQNPDTYLGNYWDFATQEVHNNSTVMSYWFYLLTMGGSGTNDNGAAYSVSGMGIDSADAICFRMNTVYLFPTAGYADARTYAIQAAIDLYGPCSNAVIQTTNAWHAVGVGNVFTPGVSSDFIAPVTQFCAIPATVNFSNLSSNAGYFTWDFGDGSAASTANSPTHVYNAYGLYTVKLISDGGSCGIDSMTRTQYINVNSLNPCIVSLPSSGTGATQTACTGQLFDNGGPTGNYTDMTTNTITISPAGASYVTLTFSSFRLENNFDFLYVYDGTTTASPLIGSYTGTSLPNGGTITSTGGSVTIRQTSDQAVNDSGFALIWVCSISTAPPSPAFTASATTSCSGSIQFNDHSTNGPITNWLWDFGDFSSATVQNPSHTYTASGVYSVKLIVTNVNGTDSVTLSNYITVNLPTAPGTSSASICSGTTASLSAGGSPVLTWYNAASGGSVVDTGNSYITPVLTNTTTYYVESDIYPAPQHVGPVDNTIGSGGNFANNNYHDVIFDCLSPVKLVSVKVFAQGAGNRTITLIQGGITIQSATVNIPAGTSRVFLNFNIPTGTNLELGCSGNTNLYRNNGGAIFPYSLGGLISITGTNAGNPAYYYYFYDWEIQSPPCISSRTSVVATVTPAPVAAYTSNSYSDSIAFVDNSTNATGWIWNFGDPGSGLNNISTSQNPSHVFSTTGNFNVCLKATDALGCVDSTCQFFLISTVGISNINAIRGLSVFPNPVNDELMIHFGEVASGTGQWIIKLVDVLGKIVEEDLISHVQTGENYKMNVASLAPGAYLVVMENEHQKVMKRIIRQ